MKTQTHRKNAEAMDNFFVTPSFAQVMQVLALGFGLAGDRQKKLSEARSFGGKQDRYSQDLLPKLLAMLAAGDSAIERDLAWRLGQMEYLLSRVRSSYLFTQTRPSKGLYVFLLVWVYPHLTALLNDFCAKVSGTSPLYHLPGMLPRRSDSGYDPVKMLQRSVRATLGKEVDAPDFLRALDRLERDSSKKMSTIEDEVNALDDEIRFQFQDEKARKLRLATVRAVYIAGIAVKRFLDMVTDIDPLPLRALGAFLDDEFDQKENEHPGVLALHEALYRSMAFSLQSLMSEESCILDELQEVYRELLKAEEPSVIPSGTNLVILFESLPLNVPAVEANLKKFFEYPQSALFKTFGLLFQGRLALYRGDLNASLVSFKLILERTESQQLGEIAHQAAGCAIALEIMTREQVQHGSLEPLILHRAQSQKQMWELHTPLPTPFSSFGGICELPIGTRQVFEAVAEFNVGQAYMPQYPARQLCNPLARLDGLLSEFFYELDRQRKTHATPQKAVRKSVTLVFGRRERSVMSIYTATPYLALRDIWSFMYFFFGREQMFHEQLNVNIQRYISLRLVMQYRILKALDPVEYCKDINAAKAKRRKSMSHKLSRSQASVPR